MTEVKICGLRSPADALNAAAAGADMLGFVFAPAKRQVTPETARDAIAAVKKLRRDNPPKCVGVFVNDNLERISHIASLTGLDVIQLSGDEEPEFTAAIDLPVIKAIRLGSDGILNLLEAVGRYLELAPGISFVFDSCVPGHYGGTGVVGDWTAAAEMVRHYPTILAGGLTPENVAGAIRSVHPLAVDVSSGVEVNGIKDKQKMNAFILGAKAGDIYDDRTV